MGMREIVKIIFMSTVIAACCGCKDKVEELCVEKVTDLTGDDEQILDIVYDRDGKIIKYGETPITYEGDKVIVGQMDCLNTGNKLCSVVFKMVKGKAKESQARCLFKVGDKKYEANKVTTYEYGADTLCIQSEYRALTDNHLLRHVSGKYVFGKDGKLREVISAYKEANDSVSSCHSYYNYDNNINYEANLNLQAYVVEREGLDNFFYFLLGLGDFRDVKSLPNDIGYCLNHGEETYNIHANYRLENEAPVRIEVLYNYTKLLSRIDLNYRPLLN